MVRDKPQTQPPPAFPHPSQSPAGDQKSQASSTHWFGIKEVGVCEKEETGFAFLGWDKGDNLKDTVPTWMCFYGDKGQVEN